MDLSPRKVMAIFALGWFGLPLFCAPMLTYLGRRYIVQETSRWVAWAIVAGLAWLVVSALVVSRVGDHGVRGALRSPKAIFLFVFWAALTGCYGGSLVRLLANCVGDSSEAHLASIEKIDRSLKGVTVVTISDPSPGVAFVCPNETWLEGEATGKRFFVHTGRLGLLWGEVQ